MDRLIIIKHPESSYSGNRMTRTSGVSIDSKEQLINWKLLKQSEGQLLATNAYALLTSDYFPFLKSQCAVFKGTDRAVFLDKREFTGSIYTQIFVIFMNMQMPVKIR